MSKFKDQDTRAKAAELRAAEARAERRRRLLVYGAAGVGVLVVVGAVVWGLKSSNGSAAASSSASPSEIAGLTTYPNQSSKHVTGTVTYTQKPPVGGDHSAVWLNAGIYDAPVPNENAVHTLEHGAFWITYQPGLAADQVQAIKDAVKDQPYALVSPYPGQPAPVEATAWGVQLQLDSATDPRLATFVASYADGTKAPEPKGEVTGGTGIPTG